MRMNPLTTRAASLASSCMTVPPSYTCVIRALSSPIRLALTLPRLRSQTEEARIPTCREDFPASVTHQSSNKPTALIGALLDVIWLAAEFADGDSNPRRRDDGLLYTVDSQRRTI